MMPLILAIFLFTLGLGTTITFMSCHWVLAWIGLEINTLAILPLIARHSHPRAVEATTKYFIAQATAATMLLFAGMSSAWLTGLWEIPLTAHPVPVTLATLAIALKIGLAPMHSWLPEVLQGTDFTTGLILSTWQKLAPIALLLQFQPTNSSLLIALGISSIMIGGWGGINQTQTRKILAYSSIAHLGWMTLVLQFSPSLAMLSLIIYFNTAAAAFLLFKMFKSTTINLLAIIRTKGPTITALGPLVLLSLAGLPPLTGFLAKWFILHELTKQDLSSLATLAGVSALLSLFFYMRLAFAMILTNPPDNFTGMIVWRNSTFNMTLCLSFTTVGSLILIPLAPAIAVMLSM
uniref:NADH-ubiquinone oxidoreductase chain 2 n=1 Tax=Spicara maena TaxID=98823 RepID=A4QIQ2_SPIMA|nr:NADH dehydrogenase subunit 2 [Spicara maena]BAF51765.1 NADH dehydrogenase subunit 2 [Spicara maena]BAQ20878.1 NADH dehydrogenase subunit 2 [Spicara maena]